MAPVQKFSPKHDAANVRTLRADKVHLDGSQIQVWGEADILERCRSPLLRGRYEAWLRLAKTGRSPLLRDLYGNESEARVDDSMLLLKEGQDFVYVHQGAGSVEKYGKIFRGVLLSTIEGGMTASFLTLYNDCLRDMRPRYVEFKTEFSARHVRWERVVLPLVSDLRQTSKFVMTYSEPLDDKLEILTAAFDRSPIGMVAAAKAVGNEKTLDDAEILLVNARARTMLNIPPAGLNLATIADLRRWMKEVIGWRQTSDTASSTSGRRTLVFRDQSGDRRTMVIVEPIDHFVIYHFIETGGGEG